MLNQFQQLLLTSAQDGASAVAVGTNTESDENEARQVLAAWYRERHERIEAELFLDQACRLLNSILSDDGVSSSHRRKARRLLSAIRAAKRDQG
jgi:hypothetical protein